MVKTILVRKIMTDIDIKDKEGEYFSQNYYSGTAKDIVDRKVQKKFCIKSDYDVYEEVKKNGKWVKGPLLLKFRKNVISKKLTDIALNSYLVSEIFLNIIPPLCFINPFFVLNCSKFLFIKL